MPNPKRATSIDVAVHKPIDARRALALAAETFEIEARA
jgi:hypothetical protein